jgi:hypothetical protein
MGKQINFYMDEATEDAFVHRVLSEGRIFKDIYDSSPVFIEQLPERFSGNG